MAVSNWPDGELSSGHSNSYFNFQGYLFSFDVILNIQFCNFIICSQQFSTAEQTISQVS